MFCSNCGASLPEEAMFCPQCGRPAGQPAPGTDAGPGPVMLTICRANQWFAINPAVKVVVDGTAEYRLENGAEIQIPVLEGAHQVVFSCGIRSKVVNIQVNGPLTLHMKWNRVTGSIEVQ